MIERYSPAGQLTQGTRRSDPAIMAYSRAYLDCGCSAFCGVYPPGPPDRGEVAVVVRACSTRHVPVTDMVADALTRTPRRDPEFVEGLLEAAWEQRNG